MFYIPKEKEIGESEPYYLLMIAVPINLTQPTPSPDKLEYKNPSLPPATILHWPRILCIKVILSPSPLSPYAEHLLSSNPPF